MNRALLFSSLIMLGCLSKVQAGSFAIRAGQSSEGLGMSYAGAASGGIGLGAMSWNPATITGFPGRTSQWNFTGIFPRASYNLISTNALLFGGPNVEAGEIGGEGVFVPASYSAYQINDRLWIGLTSTAPWGLRSKPENQNYAGQIYGRSSKVSSINLAPTIGYAVTDWLSVGAAFQGQYFKTNLKQALPIPGLYPSSILRGNDIGFGYRLGATLKPWEGGVFGIGYRSSIRHELQGELLLPVTISPLLRTGRNPIRANLNLPDSLTFGFSQKINEQWQVHVGTEWTNWSRFRRIPVQLAGLDVPFSSLNFEYQDSWYFSGGVEYAWNPNLTLRAGIGYELSPVSDRVRSLRISDNDRLWLSTGFGYQWNDQIRIDASYAHLFVKDAPVQVVPGNPDYRPTANPVTTTTYIGEAKPSIDVVSLSLTYLWDKPAAPIRPVAAKY